MHRGGLIAIISAGRKRLVIMKIRVPHRLWVALLLLVCALWTRGDSGLTVDQIVQRSVKANDSDWNASPDYSYTETDLTTDDGHTIDRKYQVLMIAGSSYRRLIARNGTVLTPDQAHAEQKKLEREIFRRRTESPGIRQARVEKYERERRQDHALMREMIRAFRFRQLGFETIDGHKCYEIEATPKPGYSPPNRDTKVLTGMRGKLWIDVNQFQWVKVHAEVFRPVEFGLFIAHVQPGTEFTLENQPVTSSVWLPSHFSTKVKATILGFWTKNSSDDETFTDYRPMNQIKLGDLGSR